MNPLNHQSVLLLEACSHSRTEEVLDMLTSGHDVNQVWPGHLRLLHVAASRGDAKMTEILIQHGADVDAANGNGETAAFLAAAEGHKTVVELLNRAKADLNASDHKGNTPLHMAMGAEHFDCARQLLWMGASARSRNVHGLRAEDMAQTMRQPQDLVDLLRATRLRENRQR
jgi:ankyrin repeat protein